jgi:hypothetical protein
MDSLLRRIDDREFCIHLALRDNPAHKWSLATAEKLISRDET